MSPDEARTLAEKIIKERFVGKVIGIDNPVFVNGHSAGEYAYPAKPVTDPEIKQAKSRASTELDNLVDAVIPLPDRPDGEGGHFHQDAVGGFSYLDTIFKVGNEYYRGIVNIVNNRRGRLLKDITKIENITKATSDSYGENPKFRNLRDVSMPNIPSSGEKSSPGTGKIEENTGNTGNTGNTAETDGRKTNRVQLARLVLNPALRGSCLRLVVMSRGPVLELL